MTNGSKSRKTIFSKSFRLVMLHHREFSNANSKKPLKMQYDDMLRFKPGQKQTRIQFEVFNVSGEVLYIHFVYELYQYKVTSIE